MDNKLDKNITTQELMALDYKYNFNENELKKDWLKLRKTNTFKKGSQFKPGMKLCQHFMPNFWNIQGAKGNSFAKAWNDPVIMEKVRTWGLTGMSNLWMSWIRRAVYMAAGLPNSSFYRPHFSMQIARMTGKKYGVLFDPCAGWGGRMLGTVANDWKYIACEPNKETYANLQEMIRFLKIENDVNLMNIPAENFSFTTAEKVDVVLTSPPYFNLEIYSSATDQSYNQFSTYDNWRDNWFNPLVKNCLSLLKEDGISAWNVMNMKKFDLVGDLIHTHNQNGWKLDSTVGFDSPLNNIRKLKNKDVTYIFRKG